ncbi:hypothetical protein F511_27810 [Dorcoceras hygrometricum]|uniref:Uncharacterized protein n=1 Tax=Dorcoceras hygrometricum TaxID=472368 RepID=A0A2Z7CRV7_9LAMI|nr:hypothetical protein F511_27810 [Dorcoceras hygrometricum]
MKLVWSPETASKAYIETVKSCGLLKQSSVAELVSAMAAGWDAKLIVETWSRGGAISTSIGLAIARNHTKGRHVCVVPDEDSKSEYEGSMARSGHSAEIIVGEPEEAMEGLQGVDFLVVDSSVKGFARILRVARLGHRGAVLMCKNASSRVASDFRWRGVLDRESRIVRSVFLPVGQGLDMAHVGAKVEGPPRRNGESRWIKHVDRKSGEEFVFRKLA